MIKITASARFGQKRVVISMRDFTSERCSDLVKNYLKEFAVLKPLALVLLQVLFHGRLHDPYSVS